MTSPLTDKMRDALLLLRTHDGHLPMSTGRREGYAGDRWVQPATAYALARRGLVCVYPEAWPCVGSARLTEPGWETAHRVHAEREAADEEFERQRVIAAAEWEQDRRAQGLPVKPNLYAVPDPNTEG